MAAHNTKVTDEQVAAAFKAANGNVSETSRMLGIHRKTVMTHVRKVGLGKKPIAKGSKHGTKTQKLQLPASGSIKRYILTSAQNNTYVHAGVWENLQALAKYYDAEILVGTFSYNQNHFGPLAVKRNQKHEYQRELWYDPQITPFIRDSRIQLGKGLVWCGEMNIMPTTPNPLSGLETYSGRQSAIFPQAKIALDSVASIQGSGSKLNYTTGSVTKRNYIAKRAGLIAEFHHTYGGLIVEVDSEGVWKVRQLDAEDDTGTIYDLTLKVANGKVTEGHRVESITWGDIHATTIDPKVLSLSVEGKDSMIEVLKPKYQFIHDLIEGASVNHHDARKPLERFKTSLRGLTEVQAELRRSAFVLSRYHRPDTQMVVVNANHDRWLDRWLDSFDPKFDDARNAEIYYDGNAARYRQARLGNDLNVIEYLIRTHGGLEIPAKFLGIDESFLTCDKKIENGQHGDLGPNGVRGSSISLAKCGRRSNIGHTHTAAIIDGLYVAGTSTTFRMGYNHGPSAWTHSHIITYPNGKRSVITMFQNAWRATEKD
jgi:hypothetical protein